MEHMAIQTNNQPKIVRNFWITANVDGKEPVVVGGPKNADGGFEMEILYREDDKISADKVIIQGRREGNKLILTAWPTAQRAMGFELEIDR
jgi:hypothetical protein